MRRHHITTTCPYCGRLSNRTVNRPGNRPKPGHVGICAACGEIAIFDARLELRRPTPSEVLRLMMRGEFDRARQLRNDFIAAGIVPGGPT